MPIFNVLRIDEKHLAKVRAVRHHIEVTETIEQTKHDEFTEWYKNIRKILSSQKALTSCSIIRIFE
jgi:hypothetical protein